MAGRSVLIGVCLAACAIAQNTTELNAVGSGLSPWTPGTVEIHQISTGRGNSTLTILPDGTTLLVGAGGADGGSPETEPHLAGAPNPGAAIGRYTRRHAGKARFDYTLITHFHPDHMAGIADAHGEIPFDKLLDRWMARL
jgi:glyoxylase-like metal-dependent hydrolase (beta-lactamase superfamily II)